MANSTDGSSALKDDIFEELSGPSVVKQKGKILYFGDYKNQNNIVEEKIENIGQETVKKLSGNQVFKNEIKTKIRSIISENEIKTSGEEINDLAEIISRNLGRENNSEAKIEAKEIRLEISKWKEENVGEVNNFKKEEFKKKFEEETKKLNPNLKKEELDKVRDYSNLISETYFNNSGIEDQKDAALEANKQFFGPGKLENAWTDLQGMVGFLRKTPGEIKGIKEKYNSIKEGLREVSLPNNLKETRSFEKIISSFNDQGTNNLFSKTQKYLGWVDKVDKFTGGWVNKTAVRVGQNFISKIGNQAVAEFAQNSLNVLAEQGFQKGFQTVMNGVLSGGVKAATTMAEGAKVVATGAKIVATGAEVAATGAEVAVGTAGGLATGGVLTVAMVALEVVKAIKKTISKIAESIGLSSKKFLEENFGPVGAKIIGGIAFLVALPALLIGGITTTFLAPVLAVGFAATFLYQITIGNLAAILMPPQGPIDSGYDIAPDEDYDSGISISGDIIVPQIPTNFTRQDLISVAKSLKGKVYYDLGGDSECIGPCPNWGIPKTLGEIRPDRPGDIIHGVDCSGFIRWVYFQLTGKIIGGSSAKMKELANSGVWQTIEENDLKPGDIAWKPGVIDWRRGHVALFIGRDSNENKIFLESYNKVSVNYVSDTIILERNMKGTKFKEYFRPNVTFSGD